MEDPRAQSLVKKEIVFFYKIFDFIDHKEEQYS
jgi:hypothetical protein